MKITDLLSAGAIDLNVTASSKEDVLRKAVDLMARQGNITDKEQYLKAVFAREEEGTTGVGDGIAIPHGRCDGVSRPGLIAMVIPQGVDYEALDDEPVDLLFLIAANPKSGSAHIDILSKLSGMLMNEDFTAALKSAKTPQEFLRVIDDAENEKDAKEQAPKEEAKKGQTKILAVTGCPTGIAHTFMAAVMIGGMVPPCAIALATLLFKNKFTEEERKSGPTNFIMGLAFITEGAIPFAASDPLHVLPSCIVGSALAGALSMAFNCTLMAPHGGIFVFPVVGNAVLLGLFKKKVA